MPVSATITVTNTGAKPAQGVAVRHSLCGEMGNPTAQLADNGNATLENGEAWVYTCSAPVVLDAVAMGVVVAQDEGPVNTRPGDIVVQKPDLKVKKRQKTDLQVGAETLYAIEVINNGPIDAPNVVMTDQLPVGSTFVRANLGSCTASGGTVRCSLGTVPPQEPGQETLIELYVLAPPAAVGQVMKNTASVSTSGVESNLADNTASASGEVFAAGVCKAGSRVCIPTADTTPSSLAPSGSSGSGAAPPIDGATGPVVTAGSGTNNTGSNNAGTTNTGGGGVGSGIGLASTGANSARTASWAAVMLASGLVLTVMGRRRLRLAALSSG